jgi:hypothetical protein
MYRFNSITNLAPLFSAMPLGAWLMLVASTVVAVILHPVKATASSSARQ